MQYRDLFKSYYCYILFLPFENSFKYYEKCFHFHLYIFLEKSSLWTNIRNKCVIKKIILHFLMSWQWVKFFLQNFAFFNMMTDSFLVGKRRTWECAWRYVCKNSLNLDCQNSIPFGIFQAVYKWKIIWKEFLLPIFWSLCLFFWRYILLTTS